MLRCIWLVESCEMCVVIPCSLRGWLGLRTSLTALGLDLGFLHVWRTQRRQKRWELSSTHMYVYAYINCKKVGGLIPACTAQRRVSYLGQIPKGMVGLCCTNDRSQEFPGGLVGTLSSHCRGLGSIPGPGTKIPQASKCSQKILKIKKKKKMKETSVPRKGL